MTITLPVDQRGWFECVTAEIVDVAPHLAHMATWAVHRGANMDSHWWVVTNVETGLKVFYAKTKKDAIDGARNRLSAKSEREMRFAYRDASKKNSESNREH